MNPNIQTYTQALSRCVLIRMRYGNEYIVILKNGQNYIYICGKRQYYTF